MSNFGRRSFWLFNKLFMVPMFRLGFGSLIGNYVTGFIMVLKTIGRKTGKVRYSPVNYAIHKGNIYCMAGWGHISDWYRNMITTREIEVILPAGPFFGVVEDVIDLDERRIALRKILQNAGFAGFFEGFNPFTTTDEVLLRKTADLPSLAYSPNRDWKRRIRSRRFVLGLDASLNYSTCPDHHCYNNITLSRFYAHGRCKPC